MLKVLVPLVILFLIQRGSSQCNNQDKKDEYEFLRWTESRNYPLPKGEPMTPFICPTGPPEQNGSCINVNNFTDVNPFFMTWFTVSLNYPRCCVCPSAAPNKENEKEMNDTKFVQFVSDYDRSSSTHQWLVREFIEMLEYRGDALDSKYTEIVCSRASSGINDPDTAWRCEIHTVPSYWRVELQPFHKLHCEDPHLLSTCVFKLGLRKGEDRAERRGLFIVCACFFVLTLFFFWTTAHFYDLHNRLYIQFSKQKAKNDMNTPLVSSF